MGVASKQNGFINIDWKKPPPPPPESWQRPHTLEKVTL